LREGGRKTRDIQVGNSRLQTYSHGWWAHYCDVSNHKEEMYSGLPDLCAASCVLDGLQIRITPTTTMWVLLSQLAALATKGLPGIKTLPSSSGSSWGYFIQLFICGNKVPKSPTLGWNQ